MAHAGRCCCRTLDDRTDRGLAGNVPLPGAGRHGLLLDADGGPLSPALWLWSPGGPDCSLAVDQPADGVAAAGTHIQGSHSDSAPSYGRSNSRKSVASLRRTHCRVRRVPSRCQPARYSRLHRTHFCRPCLDRGTPQLPQEVWPRSSQPRGGARHDQRSGGGGIGSVATNADHPCRATGGAAAWPARTSTRAPLFVASTQYAGAFLLMPPALGWPPTPPACLSAHYGCLLRG